MKTNTKRDTKGRYAKRLNGIGLMLVIGFAATAIGYALKGEAMGTAEAIGTVVQAKNPCVKVTEGKGGYLGEYDCTEDPATAKKWAAYERSKAEAEKSKTLKGFITHYGRADSCHNPKVVDGKTLCLTAIGRDTKEGVTVACPRDIRKGTRIEINGRPYVCEDVTAVWVQKRNLARYGAPTFDVFYEAGSPDIPKDNYVATVRVIE